jgi:hypothetical protein
MVSQVVLHKVLNLKFILMVSYLFAYLLNSCISYKYKTNKKLRGLSPQANYTDRATAASRRS